MRSFAVLALAASAAIIPAMSLPLSHIYEREVNDLFARDPFDIEARNTGLAGLISMNRRDLDDELQARGWFSIIKDGAELAHGAYEHHEDKKKKKSRRELEDLYERELLARELSDLEARGWFSVIKGGAELADGALDHHKDKKKNKKQRRELIAEELLARAYQFPESHIGLPVDYGCSGLHVICG